jgi:hypothetical protein
VQGRTKSELQQDPSHGLTSRKRENTMRKLILVAVLIWSMHAQGGTCHQVGGTISTNFTNSNTTLGSATGDLRGGVGVDVLSVNPNPNGTVTFHNEHHWVTESGDAIWLAPANAVAFPTGISGLFAVSYSDGVAVTGGTGRYAHARGKIYAWGADDTGKNEVVLRYEGSVCVAEQDGD